MPMTAAKVAKAVEKFQAAVISKCPDAIVSQLQACGNTQSTLIQCASARAIDRASRMTLLLYGDVPKEVAPASSRCEAASSKPQARGLCHSSSSTTWVRLVDPCVGSD